MFTTKILTYRTFKAFIISVDVAITGAYSESNLYLHSTIFSEFRSSTLPIWKSSKFDKQQLPSQSYCKVVHLFETGSTNFIVSKIVV